MTNDLYKITIKQLDQMILETPTSDQRNVLCDARIIIESQAKKLEVFKNELEKANNEFGSQTADAPDLWKRIADLKQCSGERWQRAEDLDAKLKKLYRRALRTA